MTILGPGQSTPAPWINVIANPRSASRRASRAAAIHGRSTAARIRLRLGRTIQSAIVRAKLSTCETSDTGDLWTPTALPIRDPAGTYVARHGRGYSRFEHAAHEIASDLLQYVPVGDPIKISRLVLTNRSSRPRRLSVTAYVEWVLGRRVPLHCRFLSTEIDAATGAMFAHNAWNTGFGSRVAFADLSGAQTGWTGDRREFIGRNGTLANPSALSKSAALSKTTRRGPRSLRGF